MRIVAGRDDDERTTTSADGVTGGEDRGEDR